MNTKNSYNNIFNDSLHSYYARYCDYLITEDKGLKKKSGLLYDKYECFTEILLVDEFISKIDSVGKQTESSISDLIKKIASDLYSGDIISKQEDSDSTEYFIRPARKYFNFFDGFSVLKTKPDEVYVFISKHNIHFQSSPNFREIEMITNRMIEILGVDFYEKSRFEFEKEVEKIRNNNWEGRYWDLGDTRIHLQEIKKTKQLCIQIGPLTKWPHLSKF